MKKVNNFLNNNIEKIVLIFLYIQPFIDLITSISVRNFNPIFTIGIVIRGLFLLFLFYYAIFCLKKSIGKKEIIYLILLFIYIGLFVLNMFIFKDLGTTFTEIKYLFKSFYFIFLLLFLYVIYKNKKIKINIKDFVVPISIYILFIFISEISNTGNLSYDSFKKGTTGWFYAANEVSSIIAILFPIFLNNVITSKKKIFNYILLIMYIVISLIIGTKVSFLGVLFSLVFYIIYYLYLSIKTKSKKYLKILFFPLIFSLILICLLFPSSPICKNMQFHLKLVYVNSISDFLNNDKIETDTQKEEKPSVDTIIPSEEEELEEETNSEEEKEEITKNKPDSINFILSSRDKFLNNTKKLYKDSNFSAKLLGIGYIENFGTPLQNTKSIEMDFFDIYFRFGILGFLLYIAIIMFVVYLLIKNFCSKFIKSFDNPEFMSLIISLIMGVGVSFLAGHVFTAPAVSIYIVYSMIALYDKVLNSKEKNEGKKIWIDITNSPHSILFNPIIRELEKKDYEITITARKYAQTIELLDMFKIKYTLIGNHKGKNKFKKIWGLFERSLQLYWFARNKYFDASLSMSSQTCMITSWMLDIPHMTLYDYEYTMGHHIDFRLSKQILTPKGVEEKTLKHYGANMKNVIFYPGLKEQFYIHYYIKEYNEKYKNENPLKKKLNISDNQILIVVRPEATVAHYQSNENDLCFDLIKYLNGHKKKPIIIVLPRIEQQRIEYENKKYKNVIIPNEVINGIELVASADLVIGAGGTVNREAASVGTPAYTIYKGGKLGAVDRMLIATNRMVKIENKSEFKNIIIEKKKSKPKVIGEDFSKLYVELVEKLINSR